MPWNWPHGSKWIRRSRRLALYLRDGFACVYCGVSLRESRPQAITLDHIDGVEIFGAPVHTNDNLVTSCEACNRRKGDAPLDEWATPEMLVRVMAATSRTVPNVLALSILRQTRCTKRLTHWEAVIRKAQAFAAVESMLGVARYPRLANSRAVARV